MAKYNGEKRKGFSKIHTKQMHSGQNTMEKNCICGKIQWRKGQNSLGKIHRKTIFVWKNIKEKKHLRQPAMEKRVEVSAKYIQNKCILGKIQWRKIAFGVRYNGEKVRKVQAKYTGKQFLSFLSTRHRIFCRRLENRNQSWIGEVF